MAARPGVAKRAWREVVVVVTTVFSHELTQLAAALTYYTILSLLPGLIVVVALLGIVGLSAGHRPLPARHARRARGAVGGGVRLRRPRLGAPSQNSGVVLLVSLVAALWAASAYVGSFMVASDRVYEIVQRRPFWKSLPLRVGLALALLVLLSATAAVVTLVGPFGRWVGDVTGIGTGPLHLWTWIKWPLLIALGLLLFTLLYKFTPSRRQPALWWLVPGAVAGWRLARGVRRIQLLPRQLRLVQPRVRHARRRGRVPRVGLAREPGAAGRRRRSIAIWSAGAARRRGEAASPERDRERIIGVHANRRAPAARHRRHR